MESFKTKPHNLWIMVGIPGSGKSFKAKELAEAWGQDCKYVSRDDIRFSKVNPKDPYFNKEKQVWKEYIQEIQDGIDNYPNTIADATHLNWPSRNKLIKALQLNNVNINCYYFSTPLNVCLERNSHREGRAQVPESVIKNMYASMQHPGTDPYNYYIIGEVINYA